MRDLTYMIIGIILIPVALLPLAIAIGYFIKEGGGLWRK